MPWIKNTTDVYLEINTISQSVLSVKTTQTCILASSVKPGDSVFTPFAYILLTLHFSFNRLLLQKQYYCLKMTYTLQFKQLFRKINILTVVSIQAAILPTTSRFDISRGSV